MRVGQFVTAIGLVVCASCGKAASSASAPKPPSKQDDLARIEKAKKGACADDVVALQVGSPDHIEIVEAIQDAMAHGFGGDLGAMKDIPDIASKIEAVQKDLGGQPPAKPDKPTYDKPTYSGTWPISGLCRGRYEGDQGIVLQANGKYYVIKDAEPCDTPYVNGYVESTGETVTLDLGRDGRSADVVEVKDRETYEDDQKAYRDEVAQAQADYQQAVKDYPQQLRDWHDETAAFERKQQSAFQTRDSLAKKWMVALGCPGAPELAGLSHGRTGVDPDCYGDGKICKKERVADAEALDELVSQTIAKAGWNCHQVRYIAGDKGHADAISITVSAGCVAGLDYPSRGQVAQLAATLRRTIVGSPVIKNVDLLQVTDGDEIDVELPITHGMTSRGTNALPQHVTKNEEASAPAPSPPSPAPSSPSPTSSPPSSPDVARPSDEATTAPTNGCDEVSCDLNKYEGPCCAKFKKQPKPADNSTGLLDPNGQ